MRFIHWSILAAASLLLGVSCQQAASPATPREDFDPAVVDAALSGLVQDGAIIGGSLLVYRGGQEIYFGAFGEADREAGRGWSRDTLAAIYSMTKPVTGVVLMTLYEEGLFALDDPLADHLPEYADVMVFAGLDAEGEMILEEPRRPLQVIDILRHTSCYGYEWGDGPVERLMRETNPLDPAKPLAQMSEELADLPLICHPGEAFRYGTSVDIQARLAEVLGGKPYEQLLQERVLTPLGMTDTGYFVPAAQKSRVAAAYAPGEDGAWVRGSDDENYSFWTEPPVQTNGGHGLISSAGDYMRFALMLQNGGALGDVRILRPETVDLMTTDQLPAGLADRGLLGGKGPFGFGIDFAVRLSEADAAEARYGVPGEFFWDGALSTLFWVDPVNDITAVFLTQRFPYSDEGHAALTRAVYRAAGLLDDE